MAEKYWVNMTACLTNLGSNNRIAQPGARRTFTCLTALVVAIATLGAANASAQHLFNQFDDLYDELFAPNTSVSVLSGPVPDAMNRGADGLQWEAAGAGYAFKVTIENNTGVGLQTVVGALQALPAPYLRAAEEVSEPGEDGLAIYADLGGAAGHGSKDYINLAAGAAAAVDVYAHEAGHTLEQRATANNPLTPAQWRAAIASDAVSVSAYGDGSWGEDAAEFALLYAMAMDGGGARLAQLESLSPDRFYLWERILYHANGVATWDHPGGGLWGVPGHWEGGVPAAGDQAWLGPAPTSPATITADAPISLDLLTFDNANKYTVSGFGALTVAEVRTLRGTHEIALPIHGGSGLVKSGPGTLTLSASNSYTGATRVEDGVLRLTGSGSIGGTPTIEVHAGATLDGAGLTSGFSVASGQTLTLASGATVTGATVANGGALIAGLGAFNGSLTAQAGSTIRVGGAGLPDQAPNVQVLLDNFDSYSPGPTTAATGGAWVAESSGTPNSNIVATDKGRSLQSLGGGGWRGAKRDLTATHAAVAVGETQTYFWQVKPSYSGAPTDAWIYDFMMGLAPDVSSIDSNDAWQDFSVMPFINNAPATPYLNANAPTSPSSTLMTAGEWHNVWVVIDNDPVSPSFDLYVSAESDPENPVLVVAEASWRNHPANQVLNAIGFMAGGGAGAEYLVDNIYYYPNETTANPLYQAPEPYIETLTVDGGFTLQAGATLAIDLAEGAQDLVEVTADATLKGELAVALAEGFLPGLNDQFTVLTAGSLLNNLTLGGEDGGLFSLAASTPTEVILTAVSGLEGDYNNDGAVDALDYAVWREAVGDAPGTLWNDSQAAPVGQLQFDAWLANYGALYTPPTSGGGGQGGGGGGGFAPARVPEPAGVLMLLIATAGLSTRPCSERVCKPIA